MPASADQSNALATDWSRRDLSSLADAMPHVVWTASAEGDINYLNAAWHDRTGVARDRSGHDAWLAALHPDDRPKFTTTWQDAVSAAKVFQLEFRIWSRFHGEHRWKHGRAQPLRDAEGRILRWVGSCHDIHDQKLLESSLLNAEIRLKSVIEESPVGIVILNQDAQPVYYNRRCAELRGHEVELSDWANAVHPEDRPRVVECATHAAERRLPWSGIYRFVHPDGRTIWVSARTAPIRSGSQELGFVRTLEDITELKKNEEALRRANEELQAQAGHLKHEVQDRTARVRDALAELDRLSYSIVHDMRAPLRGLQGFSELLLEEYSDRLDDQGREFLRRIGASVERQDRLIQDVLSYHNYVRNDFPVEAVDLDGLITGIAETYANLQPPRVRIQIQHPLGCVLAHQTLLTQCVSALLDNASKFVARDVKPEIRVWSEQTGDELKLWIQDNGIGIAPDYHQKIFDIFATLHRPGEYPGTGIGLPLAKKALERMQGQIGVESAAGHGSRFWISLRTGVRPRRIGMAAWST